MLKIIFNSLAQEDLVEIFEYIALDNPIAADQVLDKIDNAIVMLADFPDAGRERPEIDTGLKSFPVSNYIIFYQHDETQLEVIRVLHAARDMERLL